MCLFVAYLHHTVFWDRSDGLKGVSHLFYTTWNIFFKQYGEVGPFCLVFSLVNPAGNVPEQQTKVSFDIAVLIQSRSESVSFECTYTNLHLEQCHGGSLQSFTKSLWCIKHSKWYTGQYKNSITLKTLKIL